MLVTFDENSRIIRVKLLDSTSTVGAGKTGLAYNTSGLIISTIADVEATPTVYTQAATHIETITTLGTYAAPSASCCRFKEVDSTNHPGVYEIHLPDARYSVASAKSMIISIHGATGLVQCDALVELPRFDMQTAKQAVSLAAADVSGNVPAAVNSIANDAITAASIAANAITSSEAPALANLDAAVSTRSTYAGGAVASVTGAVGSVTGNVGGNVTGSVGSVASYGTLVADVAAAVWGALTSALTAVGSIGKLLVDRIDAAITSRGTGTALDAAGVRAAVGLASANLDTQLGDLPTNAELTSSLAAADDAVLAAIAALNNLSQANVRTAVGLASANLDTQLADLPTNAELTAALASADDATLAAIAALNNLSQANVRTAIGMASANLDTQLAAVSAPTVGEIDTQLSTTHGAGAWGAASAAVIYGEAGTINYTYTVYDVGGATPLVGVSVYVSSDAAGTYRSQAKLTDALGQVSFDLDPGPVWFWLTRSDRTFDNPYAEVVG